VRHFFILPPYISLMMYDGTNRYYSAAEFFILFKGAGMHVAHAFNLQSSHIRSSAAEFFILFKGAGMLVAHAFNLQSSHIRSE